MFNTLDEHHRQIRAGLAEIRVLCDMPNPDIPRLSAARLRLSRASSARSRYVRSILTAAVQADANARFLSELEDLQHAFVAYRLASNDHITKWNSQTIAEDWNGYRASAREIWIMMEDQITRERRMFLSGSLNMENRSS